MKWHELSCVFEKKTICFIWCEVCYSYFMTIVLLSCLWLCFMQLPFCSFDHFLCLILYYFCFVDSIWLISGSVYHSSCFLVLTSILLTLLVDEPSLVYIPLMWSILYIWVTIIYSTAGHRITYSMATLIYDNIYTNLR